MGLIPSHRHTARDLEHWRSVSACDAEIGVLAERKAAKAIEHIQRFVERCPRCYVGVSWGKDSVVVAHLWRRSQVDVPLVWVTHDLDNPDCTLVRDAFILPGDNYHEVAGVVDVDADLIVSAHRSGFGEAARVFGDAYISGIRGGESSSRNLRMRHHGVSTSRTCAPIGHWSSMDVFGYLALHDLPVHPAYAMSMGGAYDREHLRVAGIGGERGTAFGRSEWERRYYPDVWERIDRLRATREK